MRVVPNGRHTIDAMLAILTWIMQTMLDGAHPLTKHDLQPLYAQRSLLGGRPLFFLLKLVARSKPVVAGLGTNKYWVSIVE